MSLLEITRAFLLPRGGQRRAAEARPGAAAGPAPLRQGGVCREGLMFPEPVAGQDGQTELFIPAEVVAFNEARRGRKVA